MRNGHNFPRRGGRWVVMRDRLAQGSDIAEQLAMVRTGAAAQREADELIAILVASARTARTAERLHHSHSRSPFLIRLFLAEAGAFSSRGSASSS